MMPRALLRILFKKETSPVSPPEQSPTPAQPPSAAQARVKEAERVLRELYLRPDIAAARAESDAAYQALSLAIERETYESLSSLVLTHTIVAIESNYGDREHPFIGGTDHLGRYRFNGDLVLSLSNGGKFVFEGCSLTYIPPQTVETAS